MFESEKEVTVEGSGKERLKSFCYAIATLGSLGEWWLGGVIASAFAIPLIFLFRSVYWLSQTMFYWFLVAAVCAMVVLVHVALQRDPERTRYAIVWDKIIGVMIALVGISLKWRVVIFGFILFHVLNTLKPFWWYRKVIEYIEKMPGIVGVFGAELLSGVLVNVFLHLMAWVMG